MSDEVKNYKKLACIEAFKFELADDPTMHIRTYALELTKRQCVVCKLGTPCKDTLKVMAYMDNMYRSGVFKQVELTLWEYSASLQDWAATTKILRQTLDRPLVILHQGGKRAAIRERRICSRQQAIIS